jgi:hypothetical protein
MNLNEEIDRIKSIMRLNENDALLFLKRRMDLLDKYIRSTYEWLNPRAFSSLDEYIDRVIFAASRDMMADNTNLDYQIQLEIREKIKPILKDYIMDNKELYDEIVRFYKKQGGYVQ